MIPASALVRNRDGWKPRETFSPSQLKQASGCIRSWALRYLHGVKEVKTSKARMLGTLIHSCLESYINGGSVYQFELSGRHLAEFSQFSPLEQEEMRMLAPPRALSGTHLLPPVDLSQPTYTELPLALDTSTFFDAEPIQFSEMSAIDLVTQRNGVWRIDDYKSTAGDRRKRDPWAYVPTVRELKRDVQVIVYALSVMQRFQLQSIDMQWTYFLTNTQLPPQATRVTFNLSWLEAVGASQYWLTLADYLRGLVRQAIANGRPPSLEELPLPDLLYPDPESPCKAYGGCPYHNTRGGPCDAGNNLQNNLLELANSIKKEPDDMSNQLSQALQSLPPNGAPHMQPPEAQQYPQPQVTQLPQILQAPVGPQPTGVPAITTQGYQVVATTGVPLDTAGHPLPVQSYANNVSVGAAPDAPPPPVAGPEVVNEPKKGRRPKRIDNKRDGKETEESHAARVAAWQNGWAEPEAQFESQSESTDEPSIEPGNKLSRLPVSLDLAGAIAALKVVAKASGHTVEVVIK